MAYSEEELAGKRALALRLVSREVSKDVMEIVSQCLDD